MDILSATQQAVAEVGQARAVVDGIPGRTWPPCTARSARWATTMGHHADRLADSPPGLPARGRRSQAGWRGRTRASAWWPTRCGTCPSGSRPAPRTSGRPGPAHPAAGSDQPKHPAGRQRWPGAKPPSLAGQREYQEVARIQQLAHDAADRSQASVSTLSKVSTRRRGLVRADARFGERSEVFLRNGRRLMATSRIKGSRPPTRPMCSWPSASRQEVSPRMGQALAAGHIREAELFDEQYRPIDGTQPQQFLCRGAVRRKAAV